MNEVTLPPFLRETFFVFSIENLCLPSVRVAAIEEGGVVPLTLISFSFTFLHRAYTFKVVFFSSFLHRFSFGQICRSPAAIRLHAPHHPSTAADLLGQSEVAPKSLVHGPHARLVFACVPHALPCNYAFDGYMCRTSSFVSSRSSRFGPPRLHPTCA